MKIYFFVFDVFYTIYRVFFLIGPPLNLLSMRITLRSSRHLDFFRSWRGQSGTLTFFRSRLLTGQHLAKSSGGQLKKTPCTIAIIFYQRPPHRNVGGWSRQGARGASGKYSIASCLMCLPTDPHTTPITILAINIIK